MKTTRELCIQFQRMHDIVVPMGTPVERAHGTGGWAVHPSRVTLKSETRSLFKHDATYYFIWVPDDAVGA